LSCSLRNLEGRRRFNGAFEALSHRIWEVPESNRRRFNGAFEALSHRIWEVPELFPEEPLREKEGP
jgi:hypothetical protein